MKTFLLLAVSFSITLAQVANAEDQDKVKPPKTRAKVAQTPHYVAPVGPHINRNTVPANQYHPKVRSSAHVYKKPTVPHVDMPRKSTTVQANTSLQHKNWQNNNNEFKNHQKTTVQNKNWHHPTLSNHSWTEARSRHHREHHDHSWWRSRYSRFALFGSGYYFWDGGYWFPAYGYDSRYNTYAYDEPIYGYDGLEPAQVISRVQTELQRLGYYRYAVDGQMGPATRAAIANYQRDNALAMTSAIDEPTLQSLGLR